MYCTKCGKNVPDGMKFCTGCGARMTEQNRQTGAPSANRQASLMHAVQDTLQRSNSRAAAADRQIRCSQCGKVLSANLKFCTGCGTPVTSAASVSQPYSGRPGAAAAPKPAPAPQPDYDFLYPNAAPTEQSEAGFCTKCGRPIDPRMQFCTGCGAPLQEAQAEPEEEYGFFEEADAPQAPEAYEDEEAYAPADGGVYCQSCGSRAESWMTFCPGCGLSLYDPAPAPAAQRPAAPAQKRARPEPTREELKKEKRTIRIIIAATAVFLVSVVGIMIFAINSCSICGKWYFGLPYTLVRQTENGKEDISVCKNCFEQYGVVTDKKTDAHGAGFIEIILPDSIV